ncbi:MAG: glycosyltransferase family 4 protein [Owenweeksia sp.]|nr:glycosyltransferase family 4 protein [Owenweeksia sp.]
MKSFYHKAYQSNCFTFLHISTLEEGSKNITGLLKGASLLHRQGRSFLLKIGGDGDLEALRKKINEAGLPFEKVELVPEKPIKGIAALMRQCHSLLMYSHFETQSCTILEALCSGRPVVSSAVGGIPEILDKSNGILVKPNQPEALARGMAQMMDSYRGVQPNGNSQTRSFSLWLSGREPAVKRCIS